MTHAATPAQIAEHDVQVKLLTHALLDFLGAIQPNGLMPQASLEALIGAYGGLAISCPGTAGYTADLARDVADLIETHAAPRGPQNVH